MTHLRAVEIPTVHNKSKDRAKLAQAISVKTESKPSQQIRKDLPAWMTTNLLAEQTGTSVQYWKNRRLKDHPEYMELPFHKVGRLVRYRRSDVEAWMAKRDTPEQLGA